MLYKPTVFLSLLLPVCLFTVSGFAQAGAAAQYTAALKKVTDVILNDVASPVAASRYYAYLNLAAYETAVLYQPKKIQSFSGKLNNFILVPVNAKWVQMSDATAAVLLAIFKTGEKLLPSGYLLKQQIDSLTTLLTANKKIRFENALLVADDVVKQVIAYAKADGFGKLNNKPRYTPTTGNAYWQPTGPSFMAPVEPHWNTIRTFVIDSARQFKVAPPAVYDTAATSFFFKQLKEVYDVVNKSEPEQQLVANFWDCNPFAVQQIGHVEFGIKKISPGGHWIGITGIACRKKNFSLSQTALTHTLVSIAMADAFIACWDEKYFSNRVRPETVIRKLVDPNWKPLLQTPPFPEYVSGHSVVSTTSSFILTKIFGTDFFFVDDTEVEFGLPERSFTSFKQAAEEAAISRLYGGIHFRDAIEQGTWQGRQVAEYISKKTDHYFRYTKKK